MRPTDDGWALSSRFSLSSSDILLTRYFLISFVPRCQKQKKEKKMFYIERKTIDRVLMMIQPIPCLKEPGKIRKLTVKAYI